MKPSVRTRALAALSGLALAMGMFCSLSSQPREAAAAETPAAFTVTSTTPMGSTLSLWPTMGTVDVLTLVTVTNTGGTAGAYSPTHGITSSDHFHTGRLLRSTVDGEAPAVHSTPLDSYVVDLPQRVLQPGESYTYTVLDTFTVDPAGVPDASDAYWRDSLVSTCGLRVDGSCLALVRGTGEVPDVSLTTSINGDDANTAPGVSVAAGTAVTISYAVTNTGAAPLTNVVVADSNVGVVIACPGTGTSTLAELAVGATAVCTGTGPVLSTGTFSSVGRVTATAGSAVVADVDPAFASVATTTGAFRVEKAALAAEYQPTGNNVYPSYGSIEYLVTLTNDGPAGLSPAVYDIPSTPLGPVDLFVDGVQQQRDASGRYLITAGLPLATGEQRTFAVTVRHNYKRVGDAAQLVALATCQSDGATTDPTRGLYNLVQMEGDTDGAENNDACTAYVDRAIPGGPTPTSTPTRGQPAPTASPTPSQSKPGHVKPTKTPKPKPTKKG